MQLLRLSIGDFRNLRGLEIVFASRFEISAIDSPGTPPRAIRSHAIIDQNGTGKSNLIEAIIVIFRDVDLDRDAAFDYLFSSDHRAAPGRPSTAPVPADAVSSPDPEPEPSTARRSRRAAE